MNTVPKHSALSGGLYLGFFLTLALLAGCARGPRLTPEASLDYARFALGELPPEIDLDALEGRRIVIDPGHGGAFPGAVGPNNLREADVNLGVGLYLWGMLKQAGADAHLTRVADSNVYEAEDMNLKKDLQARTEFAEECGADLFVSLHHNADVLPGKKKNSLETYFKMTDPGPSFDVARSIHRRLAIGLGQDDNIILPGNFHVLRENPAPAVLGEPSYISHSKNAFRLGLAPMQRVEARAYFLGIAEYFAQGVPTIDEVAPAGTITDYPRPLIVATVVADRGVAIDPASIVALVDGERVNVRFDREASEIRYLPARRFSNGKHTIDISLRNVNGNAATSRKSEFEVAMPPAHLLLDSNIDSVRPESPTPVRLSARVFDADLMPVADGAPVAFAASEGVVSPNPSLTRDGEAVAYLTLDGAGGPREVNVTAAVSGRSRSLKLEVAEDAPEFVFANVVDAETSLPIEGALVSVDGNPLAHSDRFGYFAIPVDRIESASLALTRKGYEPASFDAGDMKDVRITTMKRIAGGVLTETRFVIDPQLGGEEKGATGPTGVRASDLNLEVAVHLARLLEASGARVALTRESDETVNELRRVEVEESFDAEWFISIGHTEEGNGFRLAHYPTSELGARLARSIAVSLEDLGAGETATVEAYSHFVLTHTGSPAVMALGPAPTTEEIEERMRNPAATRSEAYAIYCGILGNLGLDDEDTGRIDVGVMDEAGNSVSNATLALDGALHMQTNIQGRFTFSKVTPGDHRLEIHDGAARLWDGTIPVAPGGSISIDVSYPGPAAIWDAKPE